MKVEKWLPHMDNSPFSILHSPFSILNSPFLPLFFASGSEGRAKAERRHSGKTKPRVATSRPSSNAKIARNNDIANFFEQKKSLFPPF